MQQFYSARISGLRISLANISGVVVLGAVSRPFRTHLIRLRVGSSDWLRRHEKALRAFVFAVGLIPAIYFASWVQRYGVSVPKFDDWDVALLISNAHRGIWSVHDFFSQQQEGRTLVPRFLFVLSTFRGCWDVQDGMAFTVVTCLLTAVGIFRLLRASKLSVSALAVCFWLSSLLIFSPTQFTVMTFAFGFPSFLPALFIVAGLVSIAGSGSVRTKFIFCVFIAVASSFTLPHGLLAWGLTFPVLFLRERISSWPRWLAGWLIAAGICASLYFWGYRKPVDLPAFAPPVRLLDYAAFFLGFLGNELQFATKAHLAAATLAGAVTLTLYLCAFGYLASQRFSAPLLERTAPWFALGCYSIASACLAALGRIGFGVNAALSPRYVPFSLYLSIATIVLTAIVVCELCAARSWRLRTIALAGSFVVAAACATVLIREARVGLFFLRAQAAQDRLARGALMFSEILDTSAVIKQTIYPPDPDMVQRLAVSLNAQSLLRPTLLHSSRLDTFPHFAADDTAAAGEWETSVSSVAQNLHATGWAALPAMNRPADCVVFGYATADGQCIAVAMSNTVTTRSDIAHRFGGKHRANEDQRWTGWEATISPGAIPAGAQLTAWAVDTEGPVFYRLNDRRLSLRP